MRWYGGSHCFLVLVPSGLISMPCWDAPSCVNRAVSLLPFAASISVAQLSVSGSLSLGLSRLATCRKSNCRRREAGPGALMNTNAGGRSPASPAQASRASTDQAQLAGWTSLLLACALVALAAWLPRPRCVRPRLLALDASGFG